MGLAHLCHLGFPTLITHHRWVVTRKPFLTLGFHFIPLMFVRFCTLQYSNVEYVIYVTQPMKTSTLVWLQNLV